MKPGLATKGDRVTANVDLYRDTQRPVLAGSLGTVETLGQTVNLGLWVAFDGHAEPHFVCLQSLDLFSRTEVF